jgi:hypothetical protein
MTDKEKIKHYQNLLRFIGIPKLFIEHPEYLSGRKPTKADIDWALRKIESHKQKLAAE